MALGLLYGLVGTLNIADIVLAAPKADPPTLTAIAALLMLAFAVKAAAFPVNAWLPAAYHTPPPGVAALIAGLLTKVGAYALIRTLLFMLPDARGVLEPALLAVAVATMVIGPIGAIAETNGRRAIGFMLIGGIGVIVAGLVLPSPAGVTGMVLYVVHAILTLTALYLVGGLMEKFASAESETPAHGAVVSALFLLLLLSIAGVPPFLGFWPKLLLLQGLLGESGLAHSVGASWPAVTLIVAILLNAFLTLIGGGRLWVRLFWKAPAGNPPVIPNLRFGLGAAMLLTLLVFGLGLWPNGLISAAQIAAADLLNPAAYIQSVGLSP
jgi:multicomponent Na+:H+ antiporter subunit D